MEWRLQTAGLVTGLALAIVPSFANSADGQATISSWNMTSSVMQYLLIAGIALVILSMPWPRSIGRRSALTQVLLSIGVGTLMIIGWVALGLYQLTYGLSCPEPGNARCLLAAAEEPTIGLMAIGLLIPTLSIINVAVRLIKSPQT